MSNVEFHCISPEKITNQNITTVHAITIIHNVRWSTFYCLSQTKSPKEALLQSIM